MARRSGLGRGLGALIPGSDVEVAPGADGDAVIDLTQSPLREVPLKAISVNTYQPRRHIDVAELQPLADSIKELGVLQPVLVRPTGVDQYELIAGERRWRASHVAGLDTIPVLVREAEDINSLEQALVENLHRKDLNPLDEAAAYRQLIDDFSMTHDDVGKRVGKSRTAITNLLRLLNLAPKVQKLVSDGQLAEGHARALLGTDDQAFQLQLAERAVKESMSVRAVEDSVRLRNELAKPHTKARKPAKTRAGAPALEWQERLTDALDTSVSISVSAKKGKIVIDFADLEDLDRISMLISAGQSTSKRG